MTRVFIATLMLAGACLAQPGKEIAVDPAVLARYVGVYRMGAGDMAVTLEGGQLISKLGRQAPIPIFAETQTRFFPKVVDAQIEFSEFDAGGRPAKLTLYQNGREAPGTRLTDAQVARAAAFEAARQKHIQDQTATPGSDVALRALLVGLASGNLDYSILVQQLSDATRGQASQLQTMLKTRGALQSISFEGVGPAGADIYKVKFDSGVFEYRVLMTDEGKISGGQLNGNAVAAK